MNLKITTIMMVIMMMTITAGGAPSPSAAADHKDKNPGNPAAKAAPLETATFAGGCFWCMEPPFRALDGVTAVRSGYIGGHLPDPTYQDVCSGRSGHLEAIEVEYNPARISYEQLLNVFWRQIDPTDDGGSFVDRGPQYRSAIFFHDERQKALAEASKKAIDDSGRFDRPVATAILPYTTFYPAEDYHQDYAGKNPLRYKAYRAGLSPPPGGTRRRRARTAGRPMPSSKRS